MNTSPQSVFERTLHALAGLGPALVVGATASSVALAAHDDGVIRTAGAGFTGAFRALDLLASAPLMLLPFGTRVLRASLVGAGITALVGLLAFTLARELVERAVPALLSMAGLGSRRAPVPTKLISAVSFVAVATALSSPAWQLEATAPGGATLGAALIVGALFLATRDETTAPPLALLLGLGLSYEPMTFAGVLAATAPWFVTQRALVRGRWLHALIAFALGLAPLALGVALRQRPADVALSVPLFGAWVERAAHPTSLRAFVLGEIGPVVAILSAIGVVVVVSVVRSRAVGALLVVAVALVAIVLKVPAGGSRHAPIVLAGLVASYMFSASALGGVVLSIARARIPFAEASAALLVVLELALPVKAVDETLTRRDTSVSTGADIWNDVAWGPAPPAAVVLVASPATMKRIASARASGAMRGDLVVVPSFDVRGREAESALIAEPKLAPLYRDLALGLPPEELSLSQLSAQRAVLATFDPKWDRSLSRHLVPVGLSSRFEPEPRGASDRKKALDTFTPLRDRLVRITMAKKDSELAASTALLLRARAIGMAATGERDVLARALDDLRAFASDDAVGSTLVRRIVTTRGPIDVRDLSP